MKRPPLILGGQGRTSKRRALIHGFQFLALFATILAAAVWS